MSILTTIALMASSIVARIRPEPMDVEISRLQARLDELKAKVDNIERERDSWYELMQTWRSRYYELRDSPPRVTEQRPTPQAHQMMQYNQQTNLNAQNVFNQGLGAQIEQFVCNCVPARHDMLRRN